MDNAFIATSFDWDHRTPRGWQRTANRVLRRLRINGQLTPLPPIMATVEARMNLFHLLEQTIAMQVPGDVLDLGCNAGESTFVMQKMVSALSPDKTVHAYDSFEGLPRLTPADLTDGVFGEGYMRAGLETFRRRFTEAKLLQPVVHKGWFQETVPSQLPDRISFALIDGDLYESTRHLLPHVYERTSSGAIGMIAVYYDESIFPREGLPGEFRSPGVKRATDEFFADKPEKVSLLYAGEYSNGYFRKI
jgi:O-methyltransferase